ncbi:hypothetical protein DFH08DRAFT_811910 [Mycena albidolilacea]|uniref:Uncharacterized protein n=1 Tax=Mycena albidolilacea TaxID=1033008 RepID=A0AAD6ZUX3_9AGAR|nr:hypothetical protein DFH08DRAFT_811910 [Mycena albidolilacea]
MEGPYYPYYFIAWQVPEQLMLSEALASLADKHEFEEPQIARAPRAGSERRNILHPAIRLMFFETEDWEVVQRAREDEVDMHIGRNQVEPGNFWLNVMFAHLPNSLNA